MRPIGVNNNGAAGRFSIPYVERPGGSSGGHSAASAILPGVCLLRRAGDNALA